MPRRRRLFTPNKHKIKSTPIKEEAREEITSARGRFKGALKEILDPAPQSDESDNFEEETPKKERHRSESQVYLSDEEARRALRKSPPRHSYVLKLFDRSVDLSQFRDDSPLYPICRAWMANQPKANYSSSANREDVHDSSGVALPGPEGPPVAKVPDLLPEQAAANKDNINLNYREAAPQSREQLLRLHMPRWEAVKLAWQKQILLKEARYEKTQEVLNRINLENPSR